MSVSCYRFILHSAVIHNLNCSKKTKQKIGDQSLSIIHEMSFVRQWIAVEHSYKLY